MQPPSRAERGSYGQFFLQKVTNFLLLAPQPPHPPCNYAHLSSDGHNYKVPLFLGKGQSLCLPAVGHTGLSLKTGGLSNYAQRCWA